MSVDYDLKIVGGTVIDGNRSRRLPRRPRRQATAGSWRWAPRPEPPTAPSTRRAEWSSPGFVDIHTHYDAQIMWDRSLSCLAVARRDHRRDRQLRIRRRPDAPEHREVVMRTLEKVEGMTFDALAAGLGTDWPFVTFRSTSTRSSGPDARSMSPPYIGHSPLRLFVMGPDATEREATAAEVDTHAATGARGDGGRCHRVQPPRRRPRTTVPKAGRYPAGWLRSPRSTRWSARWPRVVAASCRPPWDAPCSIDEFADLADTPRRDRSRGRRCSPE